MSAMNKTLAAMAVAVGTVLGASAMAQEQQQTSTLTTEEAAGVKQLFMFNACVKPKLPDQLAVMLGKISQEEAKKQVEAAITACEGSVGVKEADLKATRDSLVAKYGDKISGVVENSYALIYNDLTDEDKAAIKLLSDFRACAQSEQQTYETAYNTWFKGAKAEYDKKVEAGMDPAKAEAEVLAANPAPQEPDIQAGCIQKVGITDADAVQARLDALTGKYGAGVLNPPAPAPQN